MPTKSMSKKRSGGGKIPAEILDAIRPMDPRAALEALCRDKPAMKPALKKALEQLEIELAAKKK